jgi:D-alanyl-D-alanine carboxypeptidase/D-alanyl-D-alanine-endopeptidase (penicillin-binding protein 4)
MSWRSVAALAVIINLVAALTTVVAAPRTGYVLIDANSGQQLAAKSQNTAFMPASTMKLVTILSALDHLGPDHRFETSLSVNGLVNDNMLQGDIVLQGNGDVELDLNDLMRMGLTLRQIGIRAVRGRFVVSDNAFLRVNEINPTQPLDAPYNAGVGPLSLAFGRVTVRSQDNGRLFTNPQLIERGPAWRIANAKRKRARAIPVRDVGMHTALSLRRMAGELGIDLPVPERGALPAQMQKIVRIQSKPLVNMIEGTMVYSNNQLAETIGLATASKLKPGSKTLAESAVTLWRDLLPRLPQANWQGFTITNHSGLDSSARATPAQLAALLKYGLSRHQLPYLLPANAWSGSLSRRMIEAGRLQRIWAKTGSIDFATALSGYLLPESGGLWLFAIISDDPERRAVYDAMPEPSAEIRKESKGWERDIKRQHDVLLRRWISGVF